jgi:hypothetical protein
VPTPRLPTRRWGGVTAALLGPARQAAAAKASSWVKQRPALAPGTEENLLVDPATGAVTEGASSNVFVCVAGGEWRTAAEGVLMGTVRGLVIEAIANLARDWPYVCPLGFLIVPTSKIYLTSTPLCWPVVFFGFVCFFAFYGFVATVRVCFFLFLFFVFVFAFLDPLQLTI